MMCHHVNYTHMLQSKIYILQCKLTELLQFILVWLVYPCCIHFQQLATRASLLLPPHLLYGCTSLCTTNQTQLLGFPPPLLVSVDNSTVLFLVSISPSLLTLPASVRYHADIVFYNDFLFDTRSSFPSS